MKIVNESPYYPIIQEFCLSLPNVMEDYPRNNITFKVNKRIFMLTDDCSPLAITVKSDPKKNKILLEHPYISVASYMGRFGWITIKISSHNIIELAKDLILESYLIVSKQKPKKKGRYDAPKF